MFEYLDYFDKSKPIIDKVPVPDFTKFKHPDLEKQKYYEKEDEKYREGIGEYFDCCGSRVRLIPGSLYFGVQNGWLKNRQSGRIEEYKARDVNLLTHQHIRESFLKKKISLILKPRGSGFSSDVAGIFPAWIWRIHPGATVVMTSKDSKTSQALYNDKLRVFLQNCPKEIFDYSWEKEGGSKIKEATTGNITVTFRSSYYDANGIQRDAESEIFVRETSQTPESASAFASKGAMLGIVDEFFLHKRFSPLMDSMINLFQNPSTGEMEGYAICGGVLEHSVQAKDLQGLLEIWDSADAMGFNKLFLPCYMGKHCDKNGWSDKERYLIYYDAKIEELSKLDNTEKLIAFKKNNPRTEDDVRDLASGLDLEPDVVLKIKEKIIRVKENPPEIKQGMILKLPDEKGIDHLVFKEMKGQPYYILEPPKPGILYNLTMDATATGSVVSQEIGSKACTFVIKMVDPENPKTSYRIVAVYWERPQTVELSYRHTHNLIDYYNIHGGVRKLSAEANAGASEWLSAYMVKEGLSKFIAWNKGKPFLYATINYRDTQFFRANSFLRKYADHIDFLPLLEQMISPVQMGKKDMFASWLMFFFVLPLDFDKPTVADYDVTEMREQLRYNEQTKRMERVWIPVQVQTNTPSHQISNY